MAVPFVSVIPMGHKTPVAIIAIPDRPPYTPFRYPMQTPQSLEMSVLCPGVDHHHHGGNTASAGTLLVSLPVFVEIALAWLYVVACEGGVDSS